MRAFPSAYEARTNARARGIRHALSHEYQGTVVRLALETGAIAHVTPESLGVYEGVQAAGRHNPSDSARVFARFSLNEETDDPDRIEEIVHTVCLGLRVYILNVIVEDDQDYKLLRWLNP